MPSKRFWSSNNIQDLALVLLICLQLYLMSRTCPVMLSLEFMNLSCNSVSDVFLALLVETAQHIIVIISNQRLLINYGHNQPSSIPS